jgi:hypothetical protein
MRASTLANACAFAVIIAGANAQDFSGVCLDPSDYDGSKEYTYEDDDGTTGTSTCDAAIAYNLAPDKPLKNEDFSQAWSCEGKSSAVTDLVQGITSLGCCGVNGKSACWKNYSYVCLDPSDYDGSKEYTYEDDDGTTGTSTCDAAIAYNLAPDKPLKDEDFSQAWSCEGKSSAVTDLVQGITSLGCCGVNGKSACFKNHAYACKDPNDWLPDKTYSGAETSGSTMKCTQILEAYASLQNEDLTKSWSCNGEPEAIRRDLQDIIAAKMGCCGSSKKSACWVDRSNVCADPSKFLPWNNFKSEDGSFDGTCDFAVHTISKDNTASCHGEDFSQTWSCSAKSSSCQAQLLELARGGCCGSAGQSASTCHGHYSGAGSFKRVGIFAIYMAVAIALA